MQRKEIVRVCGRIACLLLFVGLIAHNASSGGEVLYNGIVLLEQWPPLGGPTQEYKLPPYLLNPPSTIRIDIGRQLFVDDFLIESTTLVRTQHRPVMYRGNPVLAPSGYDKNIAMPYSDGVWYDPSDKLFKMWHYGGYGNMICYAYSADGIHWTKPSLPNAVIPGSNMVQQIGGQRDSVTVWMDLEDPDPRRRFKAFAYYPVSQILVFLSSDGINWRYDPSYSIRSLSDRTTLFWNPFRKVWVDSMRRIVTLPATSKRAAYSSRARYYAESKDLRSWTPSDFASSFWVGPDEQDPPYSAPEDTLPQLYNLDAIAYESVLVGLFSWWHPGPTYSSQYSFGPNLVELGVGFSRDGFHWFRPTRGAGEKSFIPASNIPGTWNAYNTQSAGGGFLVVGDELWFYFSGRTLQKPESGVGSTGLAKLRRDGFYSMDAGATEGTLITRPVQFSGRYMFVNVDSPGGQLRVEVRDTAGNVIPPFSKANSVPISGNKTMQQVTWTNSSDLSSLAGRPVRFHFYLTSGSIYSFWVTSSSSGASHGYVAAGGPGFTGPTDDAGGPPPPLPTAEPTITPAGGTFPSPVTVTMTSASAGATIRYTLDGTEPTPSSSQYFSPFLVSTNTLVSARAFHDTLSPSVVTTASFTIQPPPPPPAAAPTIVPAGGTFTSPVTVSMSSTTSGATIRYTLDGAEPDVSSPLYSAPFQLSSSAILSARAFHSSFSASALTRASFTIEPPVAPAPGPSAGSVGHWTFNTADVSGATLLDLSGIGNDLTAYSLQFTTGRSGQALHLDGAASFARYVYPKQLDLTQDLTVSLWLRTTNSSRLEGLVSRYSAAGLASGYLLRMTSAGILELVVGGYNLVSGSVVSTDATPINDGQWHHVAVVIKLGDSVSFYVDGNLSSTHERNYRAATADSPFQLGLNPWRPYGTFFAGDLDEIAVYSRALSISEISALSAR